MILYQNSLMKMDYSPQTDILSVDWPSSDPYTLPEVKQTLNRLVEAIRNYDVKNLLLDSSKTKIGVSEAEYQFVIAQFQADLIKTRLQKIARIISVDVEREKRVEKMREENQSGIQLESFTSNAEALAWLTGKQFKSAV